MDDSALLRLVTLAVAEAEGDSSHAFRIAAHGEIDLDSAPELGKALDDLIEQGATLVILDASGVEFLDSSGLRVIVRAGNALSDAGGQLLIEGMSGAVQRVLEVSGLIDQYRSAKP
ncbi:MAG: STAS domain-containing protein [Ilumatobacteraceae bacterium]